MADAELTNWKCGIDVVWGTGNGADKGTAYYEEYLYHDKLLDDHKVVYLKGDTPISMSHNDRNVVFNIVNNTSVFSIVGTTGLNGNGYPGEIRYKIDRDRQYYKQWAPRFNFSNTGLVLPAYTGSFTLSSQEYSPGIPVVGTTGNNGAAITDHTGCYYRGILDSFGDEWHTLSYADDDSVYCRWYMTGYTPTGTFIDNPYYASDGKTVMLVVNPKTPCFTARVAGSGQFFTTRPKAYWTPKICSQTTYFSQGPTGTTGQVTFELRDINQNNIHYRINTGSWIDAASPTVTLNDSDFVTGSNVLEYYYEGNIANTKTRIMVREPEYPSAGEVHGNALWGDAAGYATVLERITRAPYKAWYDNYRTRKDTSGQENWDLYANRGLRWEGSTNLHAASYSLKNIFIALVNGFNYTRASAPKSFGIYAKEMLLDGVRTIDNLGYEMSPADDPIPSREVTYRGYYDSRPLQESIFAYDIMVANFRANQVVGGLTPIEDYFIRDQFANFVYDASIWLMDGVGGGIAPTMWGGARSLTSAYIAMILSEYSTPYYGTSGFGNNQTVYPLCPFETDQLTWKQIHFDIDQPTSAYPNYTWYNGLSTNPGECLCMAQGQVVGSVSYDLGQWYDKSSYFDFGLMGTHLCTWANMALRYQGYRDPRFEHTIDFATAGTLYGAKDVPPLFGVPQRFNMFTLLNTNWPSAVTNALAWAKSLPSTDSFNPAKSMQDAGVFGFAWYDDMADIALGKAAQNITPENIKTNRKMSAAR